MSGRRQWVAVTGAVTTAIFAVVLIVRLRAQYTVLGVGSHAPGFNAIDLATGRPVTLAAYRGRPILVNIWATWCEPCRVEMPALERLTKKLAGTDFRVVAVSVDRDDSSVVHRFARDLGLSFDILHDQGGEIQRIYQTTGVPESFVIDRDGYIVKKVIGAAEWDGPVNETLVRRLVDER
jgi:cytochrome c biogenesis protein CcmG, thiol:disulfide interchange protein DsbE